MVTGGHGKCLPVFCVFWGCQVEEQSATVGGTLQDSCFGCSGQFLVVGGGGFVRIVLWLVASGWHLLFWICVIMTLM